MSDDARVSAERPKSRNCISEYDMSLGNPISDARRADLHLHLPFRNLYSLSAVCVFCVRSETSRAGRWIFGSQWDPADTDVPRHGFPHGREMGHRKALGVNIFRQKQELFLEE